MVRRPPGKLRVIGGRWRSRQIDFHAEDGVRPTPDRVRQTLFDWLSPRIEGAVCLDLYAGSGALGIEALSRGAGHVSFVERGKPQADAIRQALGRLDAQQAHVLEEDAQSYLQRTSLHYETVFVDPPYADRAQLPVTLKLLERVLKTDNRVYVEWPAGAELALPLGWYWLRQKQAGQVSYGLATYGGHTGNGDS